MCASTVTLLSTLEPPNSTALGVFVKELQLKLQKLNVQLILSIFYFSTVTNDSTSKMLYKPSKEG